MFNNSKRTDGDGLSTVIAKGISLTNADLTGVGMVRIDGTFTGTINIDGEVVLGETGVFEGALAAREALIAGRVVGDLKITEATHLAASAHITGNIETGNLIVDEGAYFNGSSKMGNSNDNVAYIDKKKDKTVV